MTPRQRVQAALRHEPTERIPYNFMFTPPAQEALCRRLGVDDLQESLACHLYLYGPSGKPLYASPEEYGPRITDEFGVTWSASDRDRGAPIGHPLAQGTFDGYVFPDPHRAQRWETVAEAAEQYADQFRLGVIGDLWERACFMCGIENLLIYLSIAPAFVHELLDRLCDYNVATLEGLATFKPDGVFISDDYGFQDRLMVAPATWRTFVGPRLARMLEAAQRHGLVSMLHSCGHVSPIVPDLIDMGLDILHPIQPEAMDVFDLKREFGTDITFCGGISTQQTLNRGTPEEVREEVLLKAEQLGRGGGYILEPGITIQADVPVENMVALIQAAREYRRG